jgi:hypothetical protein
MYDGERQKANQVNLGEESSPSFLKLLLLRNAPAGNHQLVAEDLVEGGTISSIRNAYSLR